MSLLSRSERIPLLCYVTDRRGLAAAAPAETRKVLLQKIEAAAAAGIDWIQIREKDLSGKESAALTREALQCAANSAASTVTRAARVAASQAASDASSSAAEARRARILVNDRLDVALATQAGGAHLGENSLPPHEAHRLANSLHRKKDFLIGVSCHSLEAATAAGQGGADYLFFGPVFTTPSKAAYGAPQGLEHLARVCRAVSPPVLAIGGITLENCAACLSAGASGIAAIRLFQDAPDLAAVVRAFRKITA